MKKYDKYKDSGIEWIGEIPEHWDFNKLRYYISANDGGVWGNDNGNVYVLRSTEINVDGSWNFENEPAKRELTDREYKKALLFEGDLLITKSSGSELHIGKTALVNKKIEEMKCCYSNFMQRIRLNNEQNSSLFYYFFNSILAREQYNYLSNTTTGLANLGSELISNILLPIPPLPEQTAIANYLDRKTTEIDNLIAKKEQLLKLYDEEKTAIINQAVTKGINPNVKMKDSGIEWLGEIPDHWEVKKLKYVVKLITEKNGEDLQKVGLENIESNSGRFIETNSEFKGEGVKFKIGDILYSKLRPYLAKVLLSNFEGAAVGDFFVLRPNGNYFSDFIKYRLLSSSFTEISNSSTYGAKMPRVSWVFMAHLFFAIPNNEEQNTIVKHIETETTRINTIIDKTKKLIELLKEYKTALISEVVTGKVKVV